MQVLLNNLGVNYLWMGRYKRAEDCFESVIRTWGASEKDALSSGDEKPAPPNALQALIHGNLSALYTEMKRFDNAEPRLRKAVKIAEKLRQADPMVEVYTLTQLGEWQLAG